MVNKHNQEAFGSISPNEVRFERRIPPAIVRFIERTRHEATGALSIVKTVLLLSLAFCLMLYAGFASQVENGSQPRETEEEQMPTVFTGEIIPVFYVRDVARSVGYYSDSLGFEFYSYYDYEANEPVLEWTKESPPIYAEMGAGDLKFGLHRPRDPDALVVGGMKHYFGVEDVRVHHSRLRQLGISVSDIREMPWMTLFRVEDPDGHSIFFFTRPE